MSDENGSAIDGLISILNSQKKSELKKLCRDLRLTSHALSEFIYAGMIGLLHPYEHFRIHREIKDPSLEPTDEEHEALGRSEVGKPLEKGAQKFMQKIDQTFKQRVLLNAHFFIAEPYWHLFYFSQRDTSSDAPHWEHGSHIHLMNWLTHPQLSPPKLVVELYSPKPKLGGSIHIRYKRRELGRGGRTRPSR